MESQAYLPHPPGPTLGKVFGAPASSFLRLQGKEKHWRTKEGETLRKSRRGRPSRGQLKAWLAGPRAQPYSGSRNSAVIGEGGDRGQPFLAAGS